MRVGTLLICTFILLASSNIFTQRTCGLDHVVQIRKSADPSFNPNLYAQRASQHMILRSGHAVITIPVIVHVVHNGTPIGKDENVATALIHAQIDQLNKDFRRVNADRVNTPAEFATRAADVEIEFCLAQQDTAGMPTTGIKRYNFGKASFSPDEFKRIVQSKTTWDRDRYLNIWIADIRGYLGYAYLPGGEAIGDGLTIDYTTVGSATQPNPYPSPYAFGRTATHEIAHWLGLDHHWAIPNDCFMDDGVGDTPKQRNYYYGHPQYPQTSCSSSDMFMNFLDYVDDKAMNLFTKGQKNVMHHVLDNERQRLKTSIGCQAAQPEIMFRQTAMSSLEGSRNCNSSGKNAYTIWLDIAAPPSRTATVNIRPSGTAIEGQDYILSRKSISFPAGSSQGQSFEIILIEDDYVEGKKDVELHFTVFSNGGNARPGHSRQTYHFDILNDDRIPEASGVMSTSIGHFMGASATASPFKGASTDARLEVLIDADDLNSSGLKAGWLSALSFFIEKKNSSRPYNDLTVKMALTEQETYGKYPSFHDGMAIVYKKTYTTSSGRNRLVLDTPYWWDGHSNLRLQFCYDNSATSGNDLVRYEITDPIKKTIFEKANAGNGCALDLMPEVTGQCPVIEFELSYGADVAISVNKSSGFSESELGPYKTVHFYDRNSGNLMLSIENLTSHDYGCTRVEIDNSGGGTSALWSTPYDRTSKAYKVTPEFNLSTGRYLMTTYFSKEEVVTWERQNRLGQFKKDLLLTKCPGSITTSTGSGCQSLAVTLKSFGTHHAFESEVLTGFSGFTLSNWPNSPLALQALSLSGRQSPDGIQLMIALEGVPEGDTITLFKKADEDDFYPIFQFVPESQGDVLFMDNETVEGEHVYYQARVTSGRGLVKSEIIHFALPRLWRAWYNSSQKTIICSQVPDGALIRIYNSAGQPVSSPFTVVADRQTIDASGWPSGMYFVEFGIGGKTYCRKVMVL